MNIAYLDTSEKDITHFKNLCSSITLIKAVIAFSDCSSLLKHLTDNYVDFVFAETKIGDNNGFEFIKEIKKASPSTRVVYVTERPEFAIRAFEVGAAGYILKPCCAEKLLVPINQFLNDRPVIEIKAFGTFDLFVNNNAVLFSNKKSKEMLALMVDRCGKSLNMEQIIDILWEERPFDENTKALYRIALKNLRDTLKKANCYHIIKESRGQRSLDTTKVKCDYYEYLKHPDTYSEFYGEYMSNYSWGEYTLAKIYKNQNNF